MDPTLDEEHAVASADANRSKKDLQIASGRILVGAMAGAAFASAVAIVGLDVQSELTRRAMYAFATALPTLCLHLVITALGHEQRHHISRLMKGITPLGILAACVGFGLMFEIAASGAGWLFVVFSVGVMLIGVSSEDRGREKAKILSTSNAQRPHEA